MPLVEIIVIKIESFYKPGMEEGYKTEVIGQSLIRRYPSLPTLGSIVRIDAEAYKIVLVENMEMGVGGESETIGGRVVVTKLNLDDSSDIFTNEILKVIG